jgi:hypothetical protein
MKYTDGTLLFGLENTYTQLDGFLAKKGFNNSIQIKTNEQYVIIAGV